MFELVDAVKVNAVKSGIHDPAEIGAGATKENRLPFRVPVLDRVIAGPVWVFFPEPLRRFCFPRWAPVMSIILCLTDTEIRQDHPPRAVRLEAHLVDHLSRQCAPVVLV